VINHICLAFGGASATFSTICLVLLWLCIFIAIYSWYMMNYSGNEAEIKRNEANCYPVPGVVADRIRRNVPIQGENTKFPLQNVSGEDGQTYCVRCLVWRPDGKCHHCRTCGRCVTDFDHHCGFYGRCIAGQLPCGGNWPWFILLSSVGQFAGMMTVIYFMASVTSL